MGVGIVHDPLKLGGSLRASKILFSYTYMNACTYKYMQHPQPFRQLHADFRGKHLCYIMCFDIIQIDSQMLHD